MVKRLKMKCLSEKKTAVEAMPYEVEFKLADPIEARREFTRFVIRSSKPQVSFEVGKTYTIDIKSSE